MGSEMCIRDSAPMAHKVVRFRSGKVVGEDVNPAPTPIADIEW